MYKRWLKEEDDSLTRLVEYGNTTETMAAILKRSIGSVQSRIHKLGLGKYHREVVTVILDEKWKCVSGFPEYKISDLGRVSRDGYLLVQRKNSRGYMGVALSGKSKEVHRLVAYHFINDTIDKTVDINHIDFDTTNNSVSNLEITTRRANITHSVKAERNLNNVPDKAVHYICSKLEEGRRDYSKIVQETNELFKLTIFDTYITTLLTKDMRQYITKNYTLPAVKVANRVTDDLIHTICRILESGSIQTSYKDVLIEAGAVDIVASSYVSKLFDGRKSHITSLYNIENGRITSRWQHLKGSTTIPRGSTVK